MFKKRSCEQLFFFLVSLILQCKIFVVWFIKGEVRMEKVIQICCTGSVTFVTKFNLIYRLNFEFGSYIKMEFELTYKLNVFEIY